MKVKAAVSMISLIVSVLALLTSLYVAVSNQRQRGRQEAAAMMNELYPVLRSARDSAFNFGKPLRGGQSDQLVTFHHALSDLADLRPAVHDGSLRELLDRIFEHQAAGLARMIDPERFVSLALPSDAYVTFLDCSRDCSAAIERCQELRKGMG